MKKKFIDLSHTIIVEHLNNLKQLRKQDFTFSAIPPKIEGFGTFPVRAFASIK